MKSLDTIEKMICKELDSISKMSGLTSSALEQLDHLTHSYKSILAIKQMNGDASDDAEEMSDSDKIKAIEKIVTMLK